MKYPYFTSWIFQYYIPCGLIIEETIFYCRNVRSRQSTSSICPATWKRTPPTGIRRTASSCTGCRFPVRERCSGWSALTVLENRRRSRSSLASWNPIWVAFRIRPTGRRSSATSVAPSCKTTSPKSWRMIWRPWSNRSTLIRSQRLSRERCRTCSTGRMKETMRRKFQTCWVTKIWICGNRLLNCVVLADLHNIKGRNVTDLSGGELQRFACAMVCIQAGDIFMFDEPSSYLDVKQRLKAAQTIRSLLREDK